MIKNVVLIRFSSRNEGNCSAISAHICNQYKADQINTYLIDGNTIQPCNGCDYECLHPEKICPNLTVEQKEVMDAICNANLAYFIIPNYCGYPCANYFAFNERSVGYFNLDRAKMQRYRNVQKRFIIVSNSEGENFTNAMYQQVNGEPDILYLKSSKYNKKSTAGDLMESEAARVYLDEFLDR